MENYIEHLKQLDEMDLRQEHYETLEKMFQLQKEMDSLRQKHEAIIHEHNYRNHAQRNRRK